MANSLWFVPSRIPHSTAYGILVFRHYKTYPPDLMYRFSPSDSIPYQPVLCGRTQSTYWAESPPSYSTRLRSYEWTNRRAKRPVTRDPHFRPCVF